MPDQLTMPLAAPAPSPYWIAGAHLSPCERYRWRLWRRWQQGPALHFIMLNPSTADARVDDPTIARCVARARRLGFGGLIVTNLFAWRATDPRELRRVDDPIGDACNGWIRLHAREAALTICGWGGGGAYRERATQVLDLLQRARVTPYALRVTGSSQPCHPLYLPYDLEPRPLGELLREANGA